MAEKSLNVTEGLSKWQIAVLVAAPIACGLGAAILYYRHRRQPKSLKGDISIDEEKSFPCSSSDQPDEKKETELVLQFFLNYVYISCKFKASTLCSESNY